MSGYGQILQIRGKRGQSAPIAERTRGREEGGRNILRLPVAEKKAARLSGGKGRRSLRKEREGERRGALLSLAG